MLKKHLQGLWSVIDRVMHTPKLELPKFTIKPEYDDPLWVGILRENKDNLLFFPGDCRNRSASDAFTHQRMSLWIHNSTGSPILIPGGFHHTVLPNIPREKVKGGLITISPEKWDQLDNNVGRGVQFDRKRVSLMLPVLNWEGNPCQITAWAYTAREDLKRQIAWEASYWRNLPEYSRAPIGENYNNTFIRRCYYYGRTYFNHGEKKCNLYFHRGLNDPVPASNTIPNK